MLIQELGDDDIEKVAVRELRLPLRREGARVLPGDDRQQDADEAVRVAVVDPNQAAAMNVHPRYSPSS
ncbi:hypothetical protein ACFQ6S_05835 [Streptomyces sp. NPDC056479]|uniref:hypothetical protein n=1 Tax=Streptomyces sp. NPDC056479 TaxID=3345832 RepID=UPI0036827F5C